MRVYTQRSSERAECKIFAKHPAKGLILLESQETFDPFFDMICVHIFEI